MPTGKLIIVTGPSGAGKGTLIDYVMANLPNCYLSVSATTRQPREGEEAGKDYDFISHVEFERRIQDDDFLEYAEYAGENFYGTPKGPVQEQLAAGMTVFVEVEVQGAKQIKQKIPEAHSIFIETPAPAIATLRARLVGRGKMKPDSIERRLRTAVEELDQKEFFDCVVVNGDLEIARESILLRVCEVLQETAGA